MQTPRDQHALPFSSQDWLVSCPSIRAGFGVSGEPRSWAGPQVAFVWNTPVFFYSVFTTCQSRKGIISGAVSATALGFPDKTLA